MKLSTTILAATVVGGVGVALAERRHRQRLDFDSTALHQRLCSDITTDERQLALWDVNGLTPEQFARSVAVNRQISYTQMKYRLGLLNKRTLVVQIRHLMERPGVREYWQRHHAFRFAEATDRRDIEFLTLLNEEYDLATRHEDSQLATAS
ncbi:DUF6082 family protein [Streptomyces sp. Wb2n-11]|uniref:DUF6082 family protein n=1 Tax=Streptomyces sp. Wb2n-11 TaxID=1030533 RepID=UPI000B190CB2|nr:DUF6082 family protein [Streptomyces sp. Wb2n-11]